MNLLYYWKNKSELIFLITLHKFWRKIIKNLKKINFVGTFT
jgi:hypothetical protein